MPGTFIGYAFFTPRPFYLFGYPKLTALKLVSIRPIQLKGPGLRPSTPPHARGSVLTGGLMMVHRSLAARSYGVSTLQLDPVDGFKQDRPLRTLRIISPSFL